MEIKSDNSGYSDTHPSFNKVGMLQTFFSFITSITMIGMSFNYIPHNIIVVISLLAINAVIYNIHQSIISLTTAQKIEDGAFQYILSEKPISGPIGLILMFITLGLLFTGNLFGWQFYLTYMVVIMIISKSHTNRLGVLSRDRLK